MKKKLYALAVVFALAMFLVGLLAHAAKKPKIFEFNSQGFGYDCQQLVCANQEFGSDMHWFELFVQLKGSIATGLLTRCDVNSDDCPNPVIEEDCQEFPIENGIISDGVLNFTYFDLEDDDGPFMFLASLFMREVGAGIRFSGGIVQFVDEDETGDFTLDALIAVPRLTPVPLDS